jgi:hypothetical protein
MYIIKSSREADKSIGRRFGEPLYGYGKYLTGIGAIVGLIALLWFPLVFLSLPGTTTLNPLTNLNVAIQITGYEPFYTQSLSQAFIQTLGESQVTALKQQYRSLFPSYLPTGSLQYASFPRNSKSLWEISPPSKALLISSLVNPSIPIYLTTTWEIQKQESTAAAAKGTYLLQLDENVRAQLVEAFTDRLTNRSEYQISIPGVYPLFQRTSTAGQVANLGATPKDYMATLTFTFKTSPNATTNNTVPGTNLTFSSPAVSGGWWNVGFPQSIRDNSTAANETTTSDPFTYFFSDSVPAISSISSYGIIGLYVAIVFTIGKFIRLAITDLTLRIIYEDLPYPDPVLQLCFDTLLAREFRVFHAL